MEESDLGQPNKRINVVIKEEEEESGETAYLTKDSKLGGFNSNENESTMTSGRNIRGIESGNVSSLQYFTKVLQNPQNQYIPLRQLRSTTADPRWMTNDVKHKIGLMT